MGKQVFTNLVLGFVVAAILASMCAMAVSSRLNAHPDEFDHVKAARYYMTYWDIPAIDDPRLADSLSNYGVTYLQHRDVVYFFAGKFAALLLPVFGQDYLALRFFNIFLFVILMGLFFRLPDNRKIAFLPLFITPQIWYVFSCFNGDAFPMFLTFCIVYFVARHDLPLHPHPTTLRSRDLRGLLGFGALLGLVCISKQNFYVFAAFTLAFFGVCGLAAEDLKTAAKNAFVVFALAAAIFSLRVGYGVYINRESPPDAQLKMAERYAQQEYKPSAQKAGVQFWGLRMRDQGVTYPQIFSIREWHIWSFRSSFGVYDYMKTYAPPFYFHSMSILLVALTATLALMMLLRGEPGSAIALFVFLLFAGLTIFQSTWHSWTSDFQAQGRYLFPIGAMAGMTLARFSKTANRALPVVLPLAAAMLALSFYSFLFVGLARIPK
jgi:hypothetical protein